ncbi:MULTISPECIES: SIS domain-containing protein [unclassified Curtobacterium]|uniref:SIS domain-containing protein n=1 Tax=unclassified Curtobacterium TaxID=257496 RepID=UPI000DA927A9|nr:MULTISPECIES: SIS domain-containing protein [unclassified Curtobacterium]PZE30076.1 tagatose-6-phosphate ketose isomerase [Curtobacterium sp. MCBD17_028]WIE55707.1 SIS domain-containing protein [Curtobacterium sp. MCBD17_003]
MTDTQPHATEHAVTAGAEATFREIRQQPAVWRDAAATLTDRRDEVDAFLGPLLALPDLRIVFTGAGTSAFAGGVVAPTIARATGRRVESIATTDLVSNPHHYLAEDVPTLLVSFARSGNSPESVAATQLADQVLAHTHHLVITCNADGDLARQHEQRDDSLVLHMPAASNDAGFAMTSSFTSMMLSALLVFLGDAPDRVTLLADAAQTVIDDRWPGIAALAEAGVRRLVYLGSGPLAALAQESALKVLELTAGRVVSYHDSSLGFRHGPKAVLDDETLAIVFPSTDPYTRGYDLDIVRELRSALGAERVLTVGALPGEDVDGIALPGLETIDDGFLALVDIVAAQILALSFALQVGTTPDNPFPGGGVNRVVQGVRIHPLAPVADER